ncbi:D-sedoheptulose-7-phosphate isomerase [Streptomyces sp. DT24]|uniref:D-sedoheptulose-7-phosphate isomerase n=1 Tax=unclassified Streptomyces TaxID=2593676 RepID=UPI0023B8DC0C|nr:SIS domain-containing protein [Streptomyces sp. AM 4-1-1]WEH36668.1 SIS domain-containing protein [Streptomyces sp. AM 4-1-1]
MKLIAPGQHCDDLMNALPAFRESSAVTQRWGVRLARSLGRGARLLVAGNGGSAAQAQHLTAELVGRYRDDRPAYSALSLHADTSSTTAIANDYGVHEVFARQTCAHGRPGDILLLLSTSGASANLLTAASEARRIGMAVWALTGPAPNPLEAASDEALCVDAAVSATVQELHLVAVHMICEAFDLELARSTPATGHGAPELDVSPTVRGARTRHGRPGGGSEGPDGVPGGRGADAEEAGTA